MRNEWSEFRPTVCPIVPGHEIVGRVTMASLSNLSERETRVSEEPNMKKLFSLGLVFFFMVMTATTLASSQSASAEHRGRRRASGEGLSERARLAWLEEEGADGKIHGADCTGMLVLTSRRPLVGPVM